LVDSGREVTALVRPGGGEGDKLAALRALGVELVEGDLKDPASLVAACADKTTVVSTASASLSVQAGNSIQAVDLDGQRNLVDAARANEVSQFVYISFSKNMDTDSPLTAAKRTVEQHLQASGMGYTILRCSFFMEIMLSLPCGFDVGAGRAVVYGTGDKPISWLSIDDVAAMVALSLAEPAARNAVIEFGGPEQLTMFDVVRVFEEASGRSFTTSVVPEEALQADMDAAADDFHRARAAVMVNYAHGDPIEMAATSARFPLPLTSVRSYADRVLSSG
jgi:uncharacterized protein YbjT (DUF2867 family)